MEYGEDDYLMLSGIQHYIFCRRQWALIHIEQQWADNRLTAEGEIMHQNAHDPFFSEKRKDIICVRSMRIHSRTLGISGECDVVEFHRDPHGVPIHYAEGTWRPTPVEYKHGTSKAGQEDKAQLCAQALCLEEMFCCPVLEASLYYGKTKHREVVQIDLELRELVKHACIDMHNLYKKGYTPKVKPNNSCNACSIQSLCLPGLTHHQTVAQYLENAEDELR